MSKPIDFRPVILAGGSGTRFWPRSRRARAKQVLALDGERSMIQQTLERLKPLAGLDKTWIITNEYLAQEIADQLPGLPANQIVQEPVARNTAPACGLAAFLIERENPDAVLGVFPSDHVIADEPRFLKALQKSIAVAAAGENIVVMGIEPVRAETGYGYIETGEYTKDDSALHVRRFIEKPNQNKADEFVTAGNYYWNSGMFLWSARTLANAVREHLPETAPLLESIAAAYGTPQFEEVFRSLYAKCENISVDYAVLEPRSAKGEHLSNLYCLPAEFSWNDLGSWASLYEYQHDTRLRGDAEGNVADTGGHLAIDASDNYIFSPKKFVAMVGVENLVVVDTEDALLIVRRDHSQDVGKIVKELGLSGHTELI
jgi:mannose-1-phosphate guanylyltransferase